jgi:STE24 endopeptidase
MKYLDFSQEEVERAGRYHRPLYASAAAGSAVSAAVYAVLAWPGRGLFGAVSGLGWAGAAAAWGAIVVAATALARLPLGVWSGLLRERRWGFSTQSPGGWLADQAKGLAVSVALAAGGWAAVVALARALPGWWPAAAAAAAALAALFLSFLAPVVLEPLFNRFRPLADERLAGELRALAERAGVPVRNVLVADASRRTTKVNAYVSGLGRTRRVVLYDTLLAAAGEPEIKLVVAHELGHRRDGHVAKGTLMAMAGSAAAVVLLWAVLGADAASPRELPLVLLLLIPFEIAALPWGAALSRRWERAADLCSLELTGDVGTFERAMIELARRNLSDLAPPRLVYLLLFSHPTPPERLAFARGVTFTL